MEPNINYKLINFWPIFWPIFFRFKVKEANIYSSKHFFKLINYHVLFSDGFGVTPKPGQKPTKNSLPF